MTTTNKPGRVLLVEDVDAMRLYLRLMLENHGFEVIEAATLKQARGQLRNHVRPTSVLLDLELPDGHGLDIIRELPEGTPVIALSADVTGETRLRCRQAGCAEILSKGGRLDNLIRTLNEKEHDAARLKQHSSQEANLANQYNSFLAETRVELEQAVGSNNLEKIRRISHRLRGTAIHFGYGGISKCAGAIGSAIASGNTAQIESMVELLLQQLFDAADLSHAG